MINKVNIENYKSIVDLELELGRVNIIVGANGSGKSNILEAIALASAANQGRLDKSYLEDRIRLPKPEFMCSEFEELGREEMPTFNISVYTQNNDRYEYILAYTSDEPELQDFSNFVQDVNIKKAIDLALSSDNNNLKNELSELIKSSDGIENTDDIVGLDKLESIRKTLDLIRNNTYKKPDIANFLIYAPVESNLRKFSDTRIYPLGREGDGLFQHLKDLISDEENGVEIMKALNEGLSLLDWFEEIEVPNDLFVEERRLNISDRFLKDTAKVFDQRSTNEGFLFLLFYLTLFNSPKTPAFFAIDNVENALNPKLARKLITHLIDVAKRRGKQVIFTTHSPYVLDGLDLSDDDQRLFVVDRNIDGHTEINRIPHRKSRTKRLSELWMEGVIGGLPDNF